jgi:hypothetical protein
VIFGRLVEPERLVPTAAAAGSRSAFYQWWRYSAVLGVLLGLGVAQACAGAPLLNVRAVSKVNAMALPLGQAEDGVLHLLTYNVAGLPALISPSDPERTLPFVSPLLNAYDLVFAQEDFAYHEQLVAQAGHSYQFRPKPAEAAFVGNGLTTLSNYPIDEVTHVSWEVCNGYFSGLSDCLGEKGFSIGRIRVSRDVSFDVYNIHADAGTDPGDIAARKSEYAQLARFIEEHSKGSAIVLAGDTNLDVSVAADRAMLDEFMAKTGLEDSCRRVG